MRKVQIYSRRGCHLCDEALQTLEILQRELGFEIEVIFIDGDYSGDITATSLGFATNPQVGVGVASVGYYFVKNKIPLTSTPSTTYDKTYLLSWQ